MSIWRGGTTNYSGKWKVNRIGHILRRKCFQKHVVEGNTAGNIKVTGRGGNRSKQLLFDLEEKRGYRRLKEEALDRTLGRTRFGRGCGRVVRLQNEWTNTNNEQINERVLAESFDFLVPAGCLQRISLSPAVYNSNPVFATSICKFRRVQATNAQPLAVCVCVCVCVCVSWFSQ